MASVVAFLESLVLRWTFYVIAFQGVLSFVGTCVLIYLCIWRRIRKEHEKKFIPEVKDKFTAIACGLEEDKEPLRLLNGYDRRKAKEIILPIMAGLQGESHQRLCKLYIELGFHQEDYKELMHKNFAVRLGAIARLETLGDARSVGLVRPLLRDKSPFVHFAAVRYMLRMEPQFHPRIEAEMALARLMNRYDAAREILDSYSKTHFKEFISLFERTTDQKLREVCIEIIQKNRLVNALPAVMDKLIEALRSEGHEEFNRFDFKRFTMCLTIAPMDEVEEVLQRMTLLKNPDVRIWGYRALFKVRPDLKFEYVDKLAVDDHPAMKRLYAEISEELAALGIERAS